MSTCENCREFKSLESVIRKAEVRIVHLLKDIQIELAIIDSAMNQHRCLIPKFNEDESLQGIKDLFGFK